MLTQQLEVPTKEFPAAAKRLTDLSFRPAVTIKKTVQKLLAEHRKTISINIIRYEYLKRPIPGALRPFDQVFAARWLRSYGRCPASGPHGTKLWMNRWRLLRCLQVLPRLGPQPHRHGSFEPRACTASDRKSETWHPTFAFTCTPRLTQPCREA